MDNYNLFTSKIPAKKLTTKQQFEQLLVDPKLDQKCMIKDPGFEKRRRCTVGRFDRQSDVCLYTSKDTPDRGKYLKNLQQKYGFSVKQSSRWDDYKTCQIDVHW